MVSTGDCVDIAKMTGTLPGLETFKFWNFQKITFCIFMKQHGSGRS